VIVVDRCLNVLRLECSRQILALDFVARFHNFTAAHDEEIRRFNQDDGVVPCPQPFFIGSRLSGFHAGCSADRDGRREESRSALTLRCHHRFWQLDWIHSRFLIAEPAKVDSRIHSSRSFLMIVVSAIYRTIWLVLALFCAVTVGISGRAIRAHAASRHTTCRSLTVVSHAI
jgi:hypothetical protein